MGKFPHSIAKARELGLQPDDTNQKHIPDCIITAVILGPFRGQTKSISWLEETCKKVQLDRCGRHSTAAASFGIPGV